MWILYLALKKAHLDRGQRNRSGNGCLFNNNFLFRTNNGSKRGNRLVLEDLDGGDTQPALLGARGDLNAHNRIAAQFKEAIVNAYLLTTNYLAPDICQ